MSDLSERNDFNLVGLTNRILRRVNLYGRSNDPLDREIDEISSGRTVIQEVDRAGKFEIGKCKVTIESGTGSKIVMEASDCAVESFQTFDVVKDQHLLAVRRELTDEHFTISLHASRVEVLDENDDTGGGTGDGRENAKPLRRRVIRWE